MLMLDWNNSIFSNVYSYLSILCDLMYNLHIPLGHLNISYFIIIDLALGISDTDITLISLASSRGPYIQFLP